MVDLERIVQVGTIVASLLALPFAVRSLYRWRHPIRVSAGCRLILDGSNPDEIIATIVNLSRETQYVVQCRAVGTYSLAYIIRRHVCSPLTPPHLYRNIWFNSPYFEMMGEGPKRLDPFQQIELIEKERFNHPMNLFLTPMFLIELKLSTGRTFRSKRIGVPARWQFRYRMKPADESS